MTKVIKSLGLWNIVIGLTFTAILGIGGWGIAKVANIPETYVTKDESNKQKDELSKQICDLKDDISKDIDRLITGIHGRLGVMENRLNKKVDKMESGINKKVDKTDRNVEKLQDLVLEHMIQSNNKVDGD